MIQRIVPVVTAALACSLLVAAEGGPIPRLVDGFESGSLADFWRPGRHGESWKRLTRRVGPE